MTRKIISIILILGFIVFISAYFIGKAGLERSGNELVAYFQETLTARAIENMGGMMPIEGFDAELLLGAIDGLERTDFQKVETFEGHYETSGDTLTFVRDMEQPISTAEKTLSEKGYETLLENVSKRLNIAVIEKADVDEIINVIDANGTNGVNGGDENGRNGENGINGGNGGGPRACTLEAKICPDGSAVGRTGPNCEFAPCPGEGGE